jgi:hypothetical protein
MIHNSFFEKTMVYSIRELDWMKDIPVYCNNHVRFDWMKHIQMYTVISTRFDWTKDIYDLADNKQIEI